MRPRDSFLGTGWKFPITFEKGGEGQRSTVLMAKAEQDIAESLTILFSTRPGERVMRPNYGGSLEELLYEPINPSLETYIKDLITNAILYYEPRIELESILLNNSREEQMEGRIKIALTFSIRSTNSRFNVVFDYYKQEGTITPIVAQPSITSN